MRYDPLGNLTNINYPASTDVRFTYDALNRASNMVDAVGTTIYAYVSRLPDPDGICGGNGGTPA
jgi:YD repeat-containing protein